MATTCDPATKKIRDQFVAQYEARFGYWPARTKEGQQDVWFEVIDTLTPYELEALIRKLQYEYEARDKKRKPLLTDVERLLKWIRPAAQKHDSFGQDNEPVMTLKEFRALARKKGANKPVPAPKPPEASTVAKAPERRESRPELRCTASQCEVADGRTQEDLEIERIEREAWLEEEEALPW